MPSGFLAATSSWDCDDWDFYSNPGAAEVCDGADVDEDCDGLEDEEGAGFCMDFAFDGDGDGYGVTGDNKCLCEAGAVSGYTVPLEEVADEDNVDCCDTTASTYPGAPGWYTSPNSCGSYDKNCKDGEEVEYDSDWDYDGCDLYYSSWDTLSCSISEGWYDDPPNCGNSGYWIDDCDVVDVGSWWSPDYECEIEDHAYNVTQRCR
jgi:hypothetical protein